MAAKSSTDQQYEALLEERKQDFRKYVEKTGVVDVLTRGRDG